MLIKCTRSLSTAIWRPIERELEEDYFDENSLWGFAVALTMGSLDDSVAGLEGKY